MNERSELDTTKGRMRYIMDSHGVSVYGLCEGANERTKVYRQIYGDTMLSEETIQRFLERFADVSADWLLRGHGPTYLQHSPHTYITNNIHNSKETFGQMIFGNNGDVTVPSYDVQNVPTPAELGLAIRDVTTELRLKSIFFTYERTIADLRRHIEDLETNQELLHGWIKMHTPQQPSKK